MKIIIAGAYAIGTHLAKLLSRNNQDIVLIDEDEERLANISSDYDLMTMNASPSSLKTLKNAGAEDADLYIAVTPDENMNMNSCMIAKALGTKKTVAKINNNEFMEPKLGDFFENLGISSLIYPENLAARDIVNGLKMSWVRQRWDVHDGALIMLGIKLRETCEILNEPLKDLCKPESPYHIVAIKRGDDTIIPRGDDELKMYDLAYFMTTRNYIPYIRKIVGKEHYVDVKNVMIMGGGNTGVRTAQTMPEYMNAKVIDNDESRCERINELVDTGRVMVINGDGRDLPLLIEEGIHHTGFRRADGKRRDEHSGMSHGKAARRAQDRGNGGELRLCENGGKPGHRNYREQKGAGGKSYISDDARYGGKQHPFPYDGKCRCGGVCCSSGL